MTEENGGARSLKAEKPSNPEQNVEASAVWILKLPIIRTEVELKRVTVTQELKIILRPIE